MIELTIEDARLLKYLALAIEDQGRGERTAVARLCAAIDAHDKAAMESTT